MQGLKPLVVHVAHLIDRSDDSVLAQEQKLSSSDIRRSMLGSYREAQVREGGREGEGGGREGGRGGREGGRERGEGGREGEGGGREGGRGGREGGRERGEGGREGEGGGREGAPQICGGACWSSSDVRGSMLGS